MGGKPKQDKECALQISGLSATASHASLMNVFRPFGAIVRLALNGMNGAHVVFNSKKHAQKAIKATHGAVFEGKPMSVTMVPTFRNTLRPCKKYQAGRCTMGDQCKYFHQDAGTALPTEGAVPTAESVIAANTPIGVQAIPNSVVCTHFSRGFCSSGATCRFAHILGGSTTAAPAVVKKRPCLYFAAGMCNRGNDCTFVHEGQENAASTEMTPAASAPVTPAAAAPAAGSIKRPCTYFAAGMCTRGEQCMFAHDAPAATPAPVAAAAPTKRPCSYFASGTCSRGEQCLFAHDVPVATPAPVAAKEKKTKEKKSKTKAAPVTMIETTANSDDSRMCIECEQVGVAVWKCANCDEALYCDACNSAVHKARVMAKHVRSKLPPVVKKPKNPKCGECEQKEAFVQCTDCEMPYCEACDASVHGFKSLRTHTREQFSAAASAAPVASKKTKKQAETPAQPPASEYIDSVPKYELTSDSETESDNVNRGKESDSESESDDDDIPPQIPAHIPPQSVVQLPLPTKKAKTPLPVRKQSISSESSDGDDIPAVTAPVKAKAVVPVRKQSVSSESSDDDDVPARPAAAVQVAKVKAQAPAELSEESSSDFDDEKPVVKPAAPVAAAPAKQVTPAKPAAKVASSSSSESSSSSSESSDDEDVKMTTPVVQQQQQQQRTRPAPATSSSMNGKRGISEGSTHSLVRKIEAYNESDSSEVLHLDANLNGFERLLAHDCAERLGLHHVSVGEGLERHITISRASSNKRPAPAGGNGHAKRQK